MRNAKKNLDAIDLALAALADADLVELFDIACAEGSVLAELVAKELQARPA